VDEGPTEQTKKPKNREKETDVVEPPLPPPPRKPRRFTLDAVKGGFVLKPGDAPLERLPMLLRIEAGYAIRRGNAIKRWAADDFNFIRAPLRQEQANGVIVSRADGNVLELEIRKRDFLFEIAGFDTKRDLVVRAIEPKGENEADV
jgi:hypothetical protein